MSVQKLPDDAAKCVPDLVMLVRRLSAALAKHDKTSRLPERALDYLKRMGFKPNILRGSEHG